MLAEALKVVICFIMKNHIYTFNGERRCQSKGGPIGLGLTGDVAQILMCWWDNKLKEKLEEKGMAVLMYKRMVDDINLVVRKSGDDEDEHTDKKVMELVQKLANDIHPSLQVTIDYPSKNPKGKMPILDLCVWMSAEYDQVTHEICFNVLHEYYCKDVASKAVINSRSAIPEKTKRTILTQEVLRILRNCNRMLPWTDICKHVEHYSMRMQYSGYNEEFRAQVIKSALHAYDIMIKKDERGEEPLYRPRDWKKVERANERRNKRGDWFKGPKKKYETVIFVPTTPGGELRKKYMETVERSKVKVAIVEVPGKCLKRRIQKSDPLKDRKCTDQENCMVCVGGGTGCRSNGVTYQVQCRKCNCIYIGETGRNAYTRGLEHLDGIRKKNEESIFHKHNIENH